MGLLQRLGHHVAGWHLDVGAVHAGEGLLDHAPQGDLEPFQPLLALDDRVDAEAGQLGLAGGLAGAELHPAVRHQVQHGHPLRRPGRVVEAGRRQDDAVAQPDPLVRWLQAARNTSGADECEYSSRK